jgi:hypothetical protein
MLALHRRLSDRVWNNPPWQETRHFVKAPAVATVLNLLGVPLDYTHCHVCAFSEGVHVGTANLAGAAVWCSLCVVGAEAAPDTAFLLF